jgi:integral membrane protein
MHTPNDIKPELNIQKDPSKTLQRLRIVAILEGISFIILVFVAMPLKYFYGEPEMVKKIGMLHGWLFVLYVLLLALAHYQLKWTWFKTGLGFVLSLVPFGTFYAERKMFRE